MTCTRREPPLPTSFPPSPKFQKPLPTPPSSSSNAKSLLGTRPTHATAHKINRERGGNLTAVRVRSRITGITLAQAGARCKSGADSRSCPGAPKPRVQPRAANPSAREAEPSRPRPPSRRPSIQLHFIHAHANPRPHSPDPSLMLRATNRGIKVLKSKRCFACRGLG